MKLLYFIQLAGFWVLALFASVISDDRGVDSYIVDGTTSPNGAHPWQLSLQRLFGTRWRHTCGATLIHRRFAVTASHCVIGKNETTPRVLRIVAGAHGILPPDLDAQIVNVRSGITPYGFSILFDIAVLVLDQDIDTSRSDIAAIGIANAGDTFVGERCLITGWGSQRGLRPVATHLLQEARMTVMPNTECIGVGWSVASTQICVWDYPRRTSSCFGDSGGPLVCRRNDQTPVLVGLSSFVFKKCEAGKPNVFSRISIYQTWLRRVTGLPNL